ncbi:hypothetical protein C8F01DRAFT_1090253 [Mycena amicta]|nr:hypothetical protein C8F01DRAFT_1090253 [Mycena amicta]
MITVMVALAHHCLASQPSQVKMVASQVGVSPLAQVVFGLPQTWRVYTSEATAGAGSGSRGKASWRERIVCMNCLGDKIEHSAAVEACKPPSVAQVKSSINHHDGKVKNEAILLDF